MFNTQQNLNISSHERRRLINMYVNQYNQTNIHIERLYETLDDIRNNINTLIGHSLRDNTNNNMNNNNNNNMNQRNNRFNQSYRFPSNNNNNGNSSRPYIYYDYDHPINPSTYIDPLIETNNNTQDITNFLNTFLNSTVAVRPSEDQINISSRIVRYADIQNPNSTCCAITLEPFIASDNVRQIHFCGHMFFPQSFTQWFQNNVRCPVCRYDIRTYVPAQTQAPLESSSSEPNVEPNVVPSVDTSLFTNLNTLRNPTTNSIDQVTFDISDNDITNTLLSSITSRLLTSLFTPQNVNANNSSNTSSNQSSNNDRFVYDPSNNLFLYETTIRRDSS